MFGELRQRAIDVKRASVSARGLLEGRQHDRAAGALQRFGEVPVGRGVRRRAEVDVECDVLHVRPSEAAGSVRHGAGAARARRRSCRSTDASIATTTMSPLACRDCQPNRRSVSAWRSAACQPLDRTIASASSDENMRPIVVSHGHRSPSGSSLHCQPHWLASVHAMAIAVAIAVAIRRYRCRCHCRCRLPLPLPLPLAPLPLPFPLPLLPLAVTIAVAVAVLPLPSPLRLPLMPLTAAMPLHADAGCWRCSRAVAAVTIAGRLARRLAVPESAMNPRSYPCWRRSAPPPCAADLRGRAHA